MAYYNPYITGKYNPLHNKTTRVFFIAHLVFFKPMKVLKAPVIHPTQRQKWNAHVLSQGHLVGVPRTT